MSFTFCTPIPVLFPALVPNLYPCNILLNREKIKALIVGVVMCPSVSHSTYACLHFFGCKCSLQWLVDLVGGLRLLLLYKYRSFSGTAVRYPIVALWFCPVLQSVRKIGSSSTLMTKESALPPATDGHGLRRGGRPILNNHYLHQGQHCSLLRHMCQRRQRLYLWRCQVFWTINNWMKGNLTFTEK